MQTKFVILSRIKLDSFESNNPEFISEDLIDIIMNDNTIVVTDLENLERIKKDSPYNKFEYSVSIERKDK